MRRLSLLVVLVCGLSPARPALAQNTAPLPARPIVLPLPPDVLSAGQQRDVDEWLRAIRAWQRVDKRWHNEPVHDAFGRIGDRAPKPPVPEWLEARCALFADAAEIAGTLGQACRLIDALDTDPAADAVRTATTAARLDREKTVRNTFLTRLHIDGLWTSTSSDVRIYGLVGSHISLVDIGRVQFFGPPGVILLSVPDGTGHREIRAGYTWGMSVRLGDVRLFAPSKNLTLFLTVTKVWMPGGNAYDRLQPGGIDIAGFSLAPRKHGK
jgi:hypothetical protein